MSEASATGRSRGVFLVSLALWLVLIGGFVAIIQHNLSSKAPTTKTGPSGSGVFSHLYPADPFPFERPPVGTTSPTAASIYRLHTGASATSIGKLVALSTPGSWIEISPKKWRLVKPLELGVGSTISLRGPLQIQIANGAFILAQHNSILRLNDVQVSGVNSAGVSQLVPITGRGFIDARSGALLQLAHSSFSNLGYLGDQTYGITIDGGASMSYLRHCVVRGDVFGVYIGRAHNVTVANNQFINSVIYGIDPHTYDSHLLIVDNTVTGSGVHGIVIADHVTDSVISNNRVFGSRDHGIVLFQFADHNVISNNRISGVFDALVVTDSSNNMFELNVISSVARFGIRVSGSSSGNLMKSNSITGGLVGIYVYQGASGNQFISNDFRHIYENMRIRFDAPNNTVSPNPGRSEL